jgi:Tol biopolymer transport system component
MIKHLLCGLLCPTLLFAQNMELTRQLRKTVLYGDIALSSDAKHAAWVQSTAATRKPSQLYLADVTSNVAAKRFSLPGENAERIDSDPAWAPDSKTIAFFSTVGEKDEQAQLWSANSDGTNSRKITALQGYAARPHWSPDGKQVAFLYIEGGNGGGPLVAAHGTTGVVDTAIHNQRIAVVDCATKKLRQISPADLHIYDFDWSPDGTTFVATAAPGPGDNNWWIAQIYTIDVPKGVATSIYKPSAQVAVPRWSPDGTSIAFIEGLMSDEGFSWRRSLNDFRYRADPDE